MSARRRSKAAIVLDAEPSSILDYERFVEGLGFLSRSERNRLVVAGGEMLDNVIKHGSPLRWGRVAVAARRSRGPRGAVVLSFRFKARGFAAFARESERLLPCEPRFDPALRRWRGFGLAMCRNLARRVSYRPGLVLDRIVLEFDPEP